MMSRQNVLMFTSAAIAFAVLVAIGIAQNRTGGLVIEVYGVDTLFILDVLQRVRAGGVPHVDFTLHIGALPFALGTAAGATIVEDFLIAQWVLASGLVLAGLWIGFSRTTALATCYLLVSTVLIATAISTTFDPRTTLALFYNRWAWAIAIVFAVGIFLRPRRQISETADAILIGLLAMALLVTKITFFVALIPLGILIYSLRCRWWELTVAAATGFIVAAATTIVLGASFWLAYVENLIWVASNPLRQQPGQGLTGLLTDTAQSGYFVAYLLFGFALFRENRRASLAIWLLTGFAFLFIQSQNFGNSALWIVLLAIVALTYADQAPPNDSARSRLLFNAIALISITLSLPTLYTLAQSTYRNATALNSETFSLMPNVSDFDGLSVTQSQIAPVEEVQISPRPDDPEYMSKCYVSGGYMTVFREIAGELASLNGEAFIADAQSPYWMQNGRSPLAGAAPWNYGSLRGLNGTDYVAIPRCPFKSSYQREILKALEDEGISLTPLTTTDRVTIMTWEHTSESSKN